MDKTAEQRLLDSLSEGQHQVNENPFEDLPLEELIKLANQQGVEVNTSTPEQGGEAYQQLQGEIMAHAAVHEMGLIKEALANGICRVCKEAALDIEGSSICSSCLQS